MVKIRLSRKGSLKHPFYHIIVTDSRNPRDGRFIERIGYFNPLLNNNISNNCSINLDRIKYWTFRGAKISKRVLSLIKFNKKIYLCNNEKK